MEEENPNQVSKNGYKKWKNYLVENTAYYKLLKQPKTKFGEQKAAQKRL